MILEDESVRYGTCLLNNVTAQALEVQLLRPPPDYMERESTGCRDRFESGSDPQGSGDRDLLSPPYGLIVIVVARLPCKQDAGVRFPVGPPTWLRYLPCDRDLLGQEQGEPESLRRADVKLREEKRSTPLVR